MVEEPVPAGTLLLHIGVPKTGTTAIQNALAALGPELADHGVSMPATPLRQARAALAVVGSAVGYPSRTAPPKAYGGHHWVAMLDGLAQQRREFPQHRVFVSSEYFSEATHDQVERIATDLAAYRPTAVVTLRPLGRILPSAWQQYLKSGHNLPYEEWLHAMLDRPPRRNVTPSFWRRHDHGAVVRRWVGRLGADRVRVVVLDPADRGLVYRCFSSLLGLPDGVLKEVAGELDNRSMTAAESELFRRVNVVLRDVALPWPSYGHLVRYGAIRRAVRRGPAATAETALRTPQWALDAAVELGAGYVEAIRASGAAVTGDLESLRQPIPARPEAGERDGGPAPIGPTVPMVPVDVAVEAVLGTVARAVSGNDWFASEPDPYPSGPAGPEDPDESGPPRLRETAPVVQLTTRQLVGVVQSRFRRALVRRWRLARLGRSSGSGRSSGAGRSGRR